jgi:hypothetical protein
MAKLAMVFWPPFVEGCAAAPAVDKDNKFGSVAVAWSGSAMISVPVFSALGVGVSLSISSLIPFAFARLISFVVKCNEEEGGEGVVVVEVEGVDDAQASRRRYFTPRRFMFL